MKNYGMSGVDILCLVIAFIVVSGSIIKILPFDLWGFGGGSRAIGYKGDAVIATVDGVDILNSDLTVLRYQSQYIHQVELSDQQLIEEIIKEQAIYNEAERLGLVVSNQEAEEILADRYTDLELKINGTDQIESKKASERLDSIVQTAEALGLTLEEYKTEIEISSVKKQMSIAALYDYYLGTLTEQVKSDNDLMIGQYQTYIKNLLAKANIIYY